MEDLLGVPTEKVHTDRLYDGLDWLLPHKSRIEKHLKERLGTLFDLEYDLLLYDVTSTYFEGECAANGLAKRGYSRDSRPDCLQVCIGLVVTTDGIPLGYEVFAGNRHDSTTVEEIVEAMEKKYGHANRIWVMDRGMVSEKNLKFLRERKGKLDGVVITGGEPTIHADLPDFIRAVKELGFFVKLDTNGSRPQVIEQLLAARCVDYWAMDRKASLARYHLLTGTEVDRAAIEKSTQLLIHGETDHEFRTTVIREFHPPEEVVQIGKELAGASRLILQQFRPEVTLDPQLRTATAYTHQEMEGLCATVRPYIANCSWR